MIDEGRSMQEAIEGRALTQGWRNLNALHNNVNAKLERALQDAAELSVVEFTLLDVLSEQTAAHLRMQDVATAASLSTSATTRLVNRLEERNLLARALCSDDRRGIFTELTPAGANVLSIARPVHDAVLHQCLTTACERPGFAPIVESLLS